MGFWRFLGGHKSAKILYIGLPIVTMVNSPIVTMVNPPGVRPFEPRQYSMIFGWSSACVSPVPLLAIKGRWAEGVRVPIHHGEYSATVTMVNIGSPIYWILHFYDPPKTFKRSLFWLKTNTFGLKRMLVDMVLRYMPNSDPWGPPGTPFMTIFGSYISAQISNIAQFEVYEVYKSRGASHFFSHQISRRMPPESCLGTHFRPQLWPYS